MRQFVIIALNTAGVVQRSSSFPRKIIQLARNALSCSCSRNIIHCMRNVLFFIYLPTYINVSDFEFALFALSMLAFDE